MAKIFQKSPAQNKHTQSLPPWKRAGAMTGTKNRHPLYPRINFRFVSFICSRSTRGMFVPNPPHRYRLAWPKGKIAIRGLSHINRVSESRVLECFSVTHFSCVTYIVTHSFRNMICARNVYNTALRGPCSDVTHRYKVS